MAITYNEVNWTKEEGMKSLKSLVLIAALALVASPLLAAPQGTPSGQTGSAHSTASSQTQTQHQDDENNEKHDKDDRKKKRHHHKRQHHKHRQRTHSS
jgi:ABC-type Zn2+ transport system substrate-binding protein/surface adhesin